MIGKRKLACAALLILLAVPGVPVGEEETGPGDETQAAQSRRACQDLRSAEILLSERLQDLKQRYSGYPHMVEKLTSAHRAWRNWLDAEMEFMFEPPEPGWFGSSRPMCVCLSRKDLVDERIARLERILEQPDDDMCVPALP